MVVGSLLVNPDIMFRHITNKQRERKSHIVHLLTVLSSGKRRKSCCGSDLRTPVYASCLAVGVIVEGTSGIVLLDATVSSFRMKDMLFRPSSSVEVDVSKLVQDVIEVGDVGADLLGVREGEETAILSSEFCRNCDGCPSYQYPAVKPEE